MSVPIRLLLSLFSDMGRIKKKKQRFRDLMQDVVSRFNRFVPVSHEVGLSTSAAPEIQFWSQI